MVRLQALNFDTKAKFDSFLAILKISVGIILQDFNQMNIIVEKEFME